MSSNKSITQSNPVAHSKPQGKNAAKKAKAAEENKQLVNSESSEVYRLLIKIEIKNNSNQNVMLPMPVSSSIQDLLNNVQRNFKNQFKCSSIYLDSQNATSDESLYSIDRSYKIGQCFRDCDKIVIKAESNTTDKKAEVKNNNKQPVVQVEKKQVEQKKPAEQKKVAQQQKVAEKKKPVQKQKQEVKPVQITSQNKSNSPKKENKKSVEVKLGKDDAKKNVEQPTNLSKNQKKRLKKQQEKSEAKKESQVVETPKAVEVAKPQKKKVAEKKLAPLVIKKEQSLVSVSLPSPKKHQIENDNDNKMGKNAKRKLKRAEAEEQIKQKEKELKTLRQQIYQGINGYSQEEASKSISGESADECDTPLPAKSSSEDPKIQIDSFLNKLNMIGKTKSQKVADKQNGSTGTKQTPSESSSFGSVERL